MKLVKFIGIGVAVIAAAGVIVYLAKRAERTRMLHQVADEGYETAQDVLFPGRNIKAGKLHYGPVLPSL